MYNFCPKFKTNCIEKIFVDTWNVYKLSKLRRRKLKRKERMMKIGLDMIVERMNACNENNVSLIWSLENMIKVMLGFF